MFHHVRPQSSPEIVLHLHLVLRRSFQSRRRCSEWHQLFFYGNAWAYSIWNIPCLSTESKAFGKFTKTTHMETSFPTDISSIRRQREKIGSRVDLCHRKPFWVFLSNFLTGSRIRLSSIRLNSLVAHDIMLCHHKSHTGTGRLSSVRL